MRMTERERKTTLSEPKRKPRGGRKPAPDSAIQEARELGMNPSTWRARLRKVKAGKMTLEEAKTLPVKSRHENGNTSAGKNRMGQVAKASIEQSLARKRGESRERGHDR